MSNLDYIDDYFKNLPAENEKQQFEQRILNDNSFAEEVAFYLSSNGIIKDELHQEKKQRFREIYQQQKDESTKRTPVRMLWKYAAAASVAAIIIIVSLLLFNKNPSAEQMADNYIKTDLQTMSVTMGNQQDNIQTGLNLFNTGKLPEALKQFENIVQNDSSNIDAKKYAGIVSLRLEKYDQALQYFRQLAENISLYSNPGKFYQALTLLKRNKPGDEVLAKQLLQEIKDKKLEGEKIAAEWLKKL